MSNLIDHARRELAIIGEDKETTEGMLRVVQAFVDMGHSGGSASICIPRLNKLLRYENLTPLTDDPDEWMEVDRGDGGVMWQSIRNSACFSDDGGVTYWSVDDGASASRRHPRYTSSKRSNDG